MYFGPFIMDGQCLAWSQDHETMIMWGKMTAVNSSKKIKIKTILEVRSFYWTLKISQWTKIIFSSVKMISGNRTPIFYDWQLNIQYSELIKGLHCRQSLKHLHIIVTLYCIKLASGDWTPSVLPAIYRFPGSACFGLKSFTRRIRLYSKCHCLLYII